MNFWQQKPTFWESKLNQHQTYDNLRNEIAKDLMQLLAPNGWKSILDVGGYKGAQGDKFQTRYKQKYESIDFTNQYDITKPWGPQGLKTRKFDIVMSSITLLVIPAEQVEAVLSQMFERAKNAVYIVEQKTEDMKAGEKINDDYGGKWAVTLPQIARNRFLFQLKSSKTSRTNLRWVKYTFIRRQPDKLL